METIKYSGKLVPEERETLLNYDPIDKIWIMDSTIPKHFNKALKQGWTLIEKHVYEDGAVFGMKLKAPERAVTIRNVEKKKMSDKQLKNLLQDDD